MAPTISPFELTALREHFSGTDCMQYSNSSLQSGPMFRYAQFGSACDTNSHKSTIKCILGIWFVVDMGNSNYFWKFECNQMKSCILLLHHLRFSKAGYRTRKLWIVSGVIQNLHYAEKVRLKVLNQFRKVSRFNQFDFNIRHFPFRERL